MLPDHLQQQHQCLYRSPRTATRRAVWPHPQRPWALVDKIQLQISQEPARYETRKINGHEKSPFATARAVGLFDSCFDASSFLLESTSSTSSIRKSPALLSDELKSRSCVSDNVDEGAEEMTGCPFCTPEALAR